MGRKSSPRNRIRTRLQSFRDCATIQAGLRVRKALPLRGAFSFQRPAPAPPDRQYALPACGHLFGGSVVFRPSVALVARSGGLSGIPHPGSKTVRNLGNPDAVKARAGRSADLNEAIMSEKKESLWLVSRAGKDGRIFRSRSSARLYRSRKPTPGDYAVEPVRWGPERQKNG